MSDELKPCPFCGGEAKLEETNYLGVFVRCLKCGTKTTYRLSSSLAVKIWNSRTQPEFTPDELDVIRKALEAYAQKSRKQWELGLSIVEKCKDALRRKQC